jgi:glycosyltransferase involved in cell wall biosynthesis
MRILVGMPEKGSQGGPAACEPPFIDELRRLGHDVEEEIYAYAGSKSGLAKRVSRVRKTARRLRERLCSGNFDVVHINTSFDTKALLRDVVVTSCLPSTGPKIFLKFHGSDARLLKTTNPLLRSLGHYLLSRVDGIGVLSSEERDNFLDAGVPEEKIFVVKNVVKSAIQNMTQCSDPDFRAKLNLPADVPLLLFIGRFIEAKGLMDVIHACKLLRDQDRELVLLCVGDGPARADAETEVNRLGLGSCVRFFGYMPEEQAAEFYANSTMLVFPTYHYEGFPMVIFNAGASGLPIITTRIRAAADYLKEPDNCLWVEPKRPGMLAEKIQRLLEGKELRLAMKANNKRLVDRFSAEQLTREYVAAYNEIR